MNKKLIALAIASAMSAPAFADSSNVTIYGNANVSFDNASNGNGPTAATQGIRTNKVSSNSSRIGIKGSEDLGDGISAVFQVESMLDLAGNNVGGNVTTNNTVQNNQLASGDSFIGLSSSSMGTALLGRHDTPYKMATRGLDLFGDTVADNRSLMGQGAINFDQRQSSVLAYVTPAISGFTGVIAYVAGAEAATNSANTKGNAYSLAGLYSNGPLSASIAYERHNVGTGGTGIAGLGGIALTGLYGVGQILPAASVAAGTRESAWKIGGSYTMDAFMVSAAYEKTSDNFGAAGANIFGHNAYYLGGKYSFGSNAVKLAYTKAGNIGTVLQPTGASGAKQWSLGFDHNMSKRTSVYALYTNLKNDANAQYGLGNFQDGPSAFTSAAGLGAKVSAFSLGVKHAF